MSLYLTKPRYLLVLHRQRQRIADGLPFTKLDSDAIGAKETAASWGLCSNEKEAWPDAEDHLFPDLFTKNGRVSPLYRKEPLRCPMDKREQAGGDGCFYTCRIFTTHKIRAKDRDKALAAYDKAIAAAEPTNPPLAEI